MAAHPIPWPSSCSSWQCQDLHGCCWWSCADRWQTEVQSLHSSEHSCPRDNSVLLLCRKVRTIPLHWARDLPSMEGFLTTWNPPRSPPCRRAPSRSRWCPPPRGSSPASAVPLVDGPWLPRASCPEVEWNFFIFIIVIIVALANPMVRALELCCEFTPPFIGGVSPSDPPRPQRDLAVQL